MCLNAVTTNITIVIPFIDNCLDSLCEKEGFPELDAICGYCKMPKSRIDRSKVALFSYHPGFFTSLPEFLLA